MSKLMLMDAKHPSETRVVIVDDETIEDFDFVTSSKAQIKGNIYLAKITRVEPSLQAAFVEYGGNKQGFLPFSEIHPDYYQIPVEDRKKLLAEEQQEAEREEEAEEAELENRDKKRGGRGRHRRRGRGRDRAREGEGESDESDENLAEDVNGSEEGEHQADVKPLSADQPVVASDIVEDEDAADEHGSEEAAEVETVSADDSEDRPVRRGSAFKRYRIQEVIKRNQIVLVQVIKEERGNKGCSLTTYLSLAGRYCVLMPNSPKGGGVSRKINSGEQRRMLKEMLAELREKRGFPAIIRTAGLDRTKAEIKRDYEYLVKMWTQIREDTLASTAPSLIYEESDIIKRSLRDMYTGDIEHVLVQGADAYRDCKNFMKLIMPSHAPRVKEYKEDAPIFAVHGVEMQLASMYEPEVKLPSGGYVVIQATEALVSIDVNSGRSTTERNVEETAIKTNLEAAREVARQMRLRDIAGLIVIDFIDMYYGKNRRTLEKAMKDYLRHDRAKVQIGRISPFGLMELSRQRLRPSIAESSTRPCDHCLGTGFVKSVETVSIQIIRLLEREAVMGDYLQLKVQTTSDVAMHLLNEKRHLIQEIEQLHDIRILVLADGDVQSGQFRLYKTGEDNREIMHQEHDDDRGRKRKGRGRRGGRNRRRREDEGDFSADKENAEFEDGEEADDVDDVSEAAENADASDSDDAAADEKPRASEQQPKGRSRSRRGRRSSTRPKTDSRDASANDSSEQVAPANAENAKAADASEGQAKDKPKPRSRRRRAATQPSAAGEAKEDAPDAGVSFKTEQAPASAPEVAVGSEASSEGQGNKRRGWWNRVKQGGDQDA